MPPKSYQPHIFGYQLPTFATPSQGSIPLDTLVSALGEVGVTPNPELVSRIRNLAPYFQRDYGLSDAEMATLSGIAAILKNAKKSERKVLAANKSSQIESISLSAGFEERHIGPDGERARKKRRHAEQDQLSILQQSIEFGTDPNVLSGIPYNVAERIQEYFWDTSGTFTSGWGADSKQGECNYETTDP